MLSLTVTLEVKEDSLEEFLQAITTNAHHSFHDEPGCVYFDVNQQVENPLIFTFYELYTDKAAVEAHRTAPHFYSWREAVTRYVVPGSQKVITGHRIIQHAD